MKNPELCDRETEILDAWTSGALAADVNRHLAECPSCQFSVRVAAMFREWKSGKLQDVKLPDYYGILLLAQWRRQDALRRRLAWLEATSVVIGTVVVVLGSLWFVKDRGLAAQIGKGLTLILPVVVYLILSHLMLVAGDPSKKAIHRPIFHLR